MGIGFIIGSGGIGKTWFLDEVIRGANQPDTLRLRLTGDAVDRQFARVIEELVASARDGADFANTTNVIGELRDLFVDFERELRELADRNKELAELVGFVVSHAAVVAAVAAATVAGDPGVAVKAAPTLAKYGDQALKQVVEGALKFRVFAVKKRARHVRELAADPFPIVARELVRDLASVLAVSRGIRFWRASRHRRLMIVLDDWERLGPELERFVVGPFLDALERAPFATTILILGRARPRDEAWNRKHKSKQFGDPISLGPLTRAESEQYLRQRGLSDEAAVARILQETNGYPLLLDLLVEDEVAESRGSILSLERFVGRITQWMSDEQRSWAERLAFLDDVNVDAIRRVLPDVDAQQVHKWFREEGSLRDRRSEHFSMVPAIRSRICRLLQKQSPEQFEALKKAAAP
ncbi:MAG: hypothetical protein KIT31_17245 [Deltaproteobacteria bacterium]|nr:hypothetical protein [Deltaproteobacteria bacterium]